jgi:hypothetical protein
VTITYSFAPHSSDLVLVQEFAVERADGLSALPADLTIRAAYLPLSFHTESVWVPNKVGSGEKISLATIQASYKAAGKSSSLGSDLAIPLITSSILSSRKTPIAIYADPYFSLAFHKTYMSWTYAKEVGLEDGIEKRQFYTAFLPPLTNIHKLTDQAISDFYQTALADIPAGPQWLHRISMVSYDYMSKNGNGWKRDIDALTAVIPYEKRSQIMLTLHGWYDLVGRFSFTPGNKTLDASWPNLIAPALGQVTVDDIRARLKYAKDRGFKLGFYYADGMNSAIDPRVAIAQDPDHILRREGKNQWAGPDMAGSEAVVLNPGHPEVYQYFKDLIQAEVTAFGDLVDAYVWDETFYITAGELGTKKYPGYLDRTFMRLTKDITQIIHANNPEAAFLTSEDMGVFDGIPPYALFADGSYQDAEVATNAFSYTIFPNYRNVAFACNWRDRDFIPQMEFGVKNFQSPVVFTNGWSDDYGFSDMTPKDRDTYLQLFDWRSKFTTHFEWFDRLPQFQQQ